MKQKLAVYAVALLSTSLLSNVAIADNKEQKRGDHLSQFIAKFDSNDDSQVTKDEFFTGMALRFTEMDKDGDGVVSKKEFKKNSKSKHKDYKKKHKAKIDTDNDGLISKEEYLASKLKKAERKFARLDKDSDGFLTEDERKSDKPKHRKPKHYFTKIDKNGDGVISEAESKASSERMFQHLDSNGDDVITQDEIAAMSRQYKD